VLFKPYLAPEVTFFFYQKPIWIMLYDNPIDQDDLCQISEKNVKISLKNEFGHNVSVLMFKSVFQTNFQKCHQAYIFSRSVTSRYINLR
jgi:hypothetical protein